eukprot:61955_1
MAAMMMEILLSNNNALTDKAKRLGDCVNELRQTVADQRKENEQLREDNQDLSLDNINRSLRCKNEDLRGEVYYSRKHIKRLGGTRDKNKPRMLPQVRKDDAGRTAKYRLVLLLEIMNMTQQQRSTNEKSRMSDDEMNKYQKLTERKYKLIIQELKEFDFPYEFFSFFCLASHDDELQTNVWVVIGSYVNEQSRTQSKRR